MNSALEGTQLFAELTPAEADLVSRCCLVMQIAESEQVFQAGDEALYCFSVLSGQVELQFSVVCYGETVAFPLDTKSKGDLFGWSAMLPERRYTLTARATRSSELLRIDAAELLRICRTQPRVGFLVMRNLAQIIGERYEVMSAALEREIQSNITAKDPLA